MHFYLSPATRRRQIMRHAHDSECNKFVKWLWHVCNYSSRSHIAPSFLKSVSIITRIHKLRNGWIGAPRLRHDSACYVHLPAFLNVCRTIHVRSPRKSRASKMCSHVEQARKSQCFLAFKIIVRGWYCTKSSCFNCFCAKAPARNLRG